MADAKPLPFSIERDNQVSLTDQVVRGLSQAVRSGYYEAGDQVQTIVEMSETLGISTMVVRNAIKRLIGLGLITARPKKGIRVRAAEAPAPYRAHVLQLARARITSFYFAARDHVFYRRLREAKIRLSVIVVDGQESASGFAGIHSLADADPVDLAILEGPSWGVVSVLEKRRIPFVHAFAPRPSAKALGSLVLDDEPALKDLVRHCVECRAKKVLGVFLGSGEASTRFEDAICGAGLECEVLMAEAPKDLPNPENVEVGGLQAMKGYLERAAELPDLIYFADDYAGRGGLMALACAGKRIPGDVQVISLANRGNRVAFPKALTRVEADPEQAGEAMAAMVVGILDKPRRRRQQAIVNQRLIAGETTVPKRRS